MSIHFYPLAAEGEWDIMDKHERIYKIRIGGPYYVLTDEHIVGGGHIYFSTPLAAMTYILDQTLFQPK